MCMPIEKQRLDLLLVARGLAESRAKAQGLIMAREVTVNGDVIDKPGTRFAETVEIILKAKPPFVSRGGEKLEGALVDFAYDVKGLICADVGASTGGFTDCLLQRGAEKVYAIDVGYGQLAHSLRIDPRVVTMERTNARYLTSLPEPVQLVVMDASFISLRLLLPAVHLWLTPQADVIALIKPQFEAGKSSVGSGGVVRQKSVHERVIREVAEAAQAEGFQIVGLTRSPLKGPAGNIEFLIWLHQGGSHKALDWAARLPLVLTESSPLSSEEAASSDLLDL
jgi:23S rRNA (cytidine1920-2'-O)/16S rRNA (cytidine1409-2'-O)-methyltransferase